MPGAGGIQSPFGPAAPSSGGGAVATQAVAGLLCPPGFHPNRSEYFLKNGTRVPAGSRCVRNRRMNPLNPKALNRTGRRLRAAKQAARFLQKVEVPKRVC